MKVLYVDDELVELPEGTSVAMTLKRGDVGDLATRTVSRTNQFKIPFSENNDRVYKNARYYQSAGRIPYSGQAVRFVQNGIELISDGVQRVKKASGNYEVNITFDLADLFSAIETKMLNQLNTVDIDTAWGASDIQGYRNATSGVVAPVIDYGHFTTSSTADIRAITYLPSIYFKTIIDKIITEAGYTMNLPAGNFTEDDAYDKLILPFSKSQFEYTGQFASDRVSIVRKITPEVISTGGTAGTFSFDTIESTHATLETFNTEIVYGEPNVSVGTKVFYFNVSLILDVTTADLLDIFFNGTLIFSGVASAVATSTIEFEAEVGFGNTLSWENISGVGPTDFTINSITMTLTPSTRPHREHLYINELLPEMTQTEFMKEFAVRYGLFFEADKSVTSKNILAKSINEIIRNTPEGKDWTDKRVGDSEEIEFTPLSYCQENLFTYETEDSLVTDGFADGSISIDNDNIEEETEIYESPFSATATNIVNGIEMGVIPVYTTAYSGVEIPFDEECGLRLLLVRDKYAYEPNVTYNTAQSSYLVGYFHDDKQTVSLKWEYYLDRYYSLMIEALQDAKVITREYYLDEVDILTHSFLSPIFDLDSYYLVNEVSNFIPGKVTKVQLFKV